MIADVYALYHQDFSIQLDFACRLRG
jgi:hypothetical protein